MNTNEFNLYLMYRKLVPLCLFSKSPETTEPIYMKLFYKPSRSENRRTSYFDSP